MTWLRDSCTRRQKAWTRGPGGPHLPWRSHSPAGAAGAPEQPFRRQQGNAASLLPHCRAVSQEPRSGTSVHQDPTPQCTSLRCKMDLLLPDPVPWSLRGLNVARGLAAAGRRGDEATGDLVTCPELPLTLCMLIGITISLWASVSSPVSFPTYKSLPSQEQVGLLSHCPPGSPVYTSISVTYHLCSHPKCCQ